MGPGGRNGAPRPRRRLRVRGGRAAGALVAGLLLAASLPPLGLWPVAFLGAAALFVALEGQPAAARLALGWLAGLGCFGPGLWWAGSFNWYGAAVLVVAEALSMGLAALIVPAAGARVAAFAASFTLLEAARMAWPFGGLPLGGIFLGQAEGPLLPLARLGGPLVLTAAVWLGGGGLGQLLSGRRASGARRLGGLAALALLVAVMTAAEVAPDGGPATGHLTVAAVQGGGRRGTSALDVPPSSVLAAQRRATRALLAPRSRRPRLVVWPEDVVALSAPVALPGAEASLGRLARRLRATLLAGITVDLSASTFKNEVVAFGPSGRVVGTYEKVHRVPFGEYVPWRSFFSHFASLKAVPRDAVAGHGSGLLRTPAGPLGVLISFEVFFASRGRSSVDQGAELLVVPTNTSSYATSQVPDQELAASRVQAVATGRDLVQASPTGYSAVVEHTGEVVARSALGRREVVEAVVGLRRGLTFYDRQGDGPLLAVASIALAVAWAFTASRRRAGRRHS